MVWRPNLRLVRADDHVVLDLVVTGLEPKPVSPPQPGGPRHVLGLATGVTTGTISVRLPPQQIIEYAKPEGGVRAEQEHILFTPESELIFTVTNTDPPIPLTVAGLLAAMTRLPLRTKDGDPVVGAVDVPLRPAISAYELVAATMSADGAASTRLARRRDAAARRAARENAAPPVEFSQEQQGITAQSAFSQVAMPRRLAVRPPGGSVRFSHASQPVTHDQRVELWHSRLAVTTTDPAATPVERPVPVSFTALQNTVGTSGPRAENLVLNALSDRDCGDIAAQTDAGQPAELTRLMVSGLGGYLRVRGSWPTGTVKRLRVDTAQGRDQFQHVVVVGRLLPFGHKAMITSTTDRRFESGTTRAAGLQTISTLEVTEPLASCDPAGGMQRAWPLATVRITSPKPPPGSAPPIGDQNPLSEFKVDGVPFHFSCQAVDRLGNTVEFTMPMLFAAQSVIDADAFAAWQAYAGTSEPYSTIDLAGQDLGLAPAPDGPTAAAADLRDGATSVLAGRLKLKIDTVTGRPVLKELNARVSELERYAPGAGEVAVSYAQPYLQHLFAGANSEGQIFLQFARNTADQLVQPVVALGGQATAGMAQLSLPVAALSARFGAVVGELPVQLPNQPDQAVETLAALADGKLDPRFLTSLLDGLTSKLFGLIDLTRLIPADLRPSLADAQNIVTDVLDGVTSQRLTWNLPLFERPLAGSPLREGFVGIKASADTDPRMVIRQTTEVDAVRERMHSATECKLNDLEVLVFASDSDQAPIVTIPLREISFFTKDGAKPEFDVKLGRIRFGGILAFVGVLADLIDRLGLSDPPALDVTDKGVRSSFSFAVPDVAVGMFALQNIAFSTALDVRFQPTEQDPALSLAVEFSSRDNPFRLTVAFLGGGGYLRIVAGSSGLELIEGSLSFGAALAVNLGVAKGSVEAMGGVVFEYNKLQRRARLTGFLRLHGEIEVLSLISIAVTLLLSMTYDLNTHVLSGHAEVVVQVSVWFFSQSVTIPYDWQMTGANADPTFAEIMAPANFPGARPWDTYCMAFAEE